MAERLVDVVTEKLLSLPEAFGRLDANQLAGLMEPTIAKAIEQDAAGGEMWIRVLSPELKNTLTKTVSMLQTDIEQVIDLREVVSSAFLRDKLLLVQLFQKVGRRELEFLVNSGLMFGFFLGIFQMLLWILVPNGWVLPVGGALVGYITNWVAIKLIFEPIEPTPVGPFVFQGLFEKRQKEVSIEFAEFLATRVLTSKRLITEMVDGKLTTTFKAKVRETIPFLVPDAVVEAAIGGFQRLAAEPDSHPVHQYVDETLGLQETLGARLKKLSSPEFENLLHPVFQEDELTLIIAGGVLGFAAGLGQQVMGWGGPGAQGALAIAMAGYQGSQHAILLSPLLLGQLARAGLWCMATAAAGATIMQHVIRFLRLRRIAIARRVRIMALGPSHV